MYATQSHRAMQCQPNIVPLIDVLLVLLIVFMVSMPLVSQTLDWNLSQRQETLGPEPAIWHVRLDDSDVLYFQGRPVGPEELLHELQARSSNNPAAIIELDIGPQVSYQAAIRVQALMHNNGYKQVRIKGL